MREPVDPEFASYVDARQGRWLRAAYLVYGDLDVAEEQLRHAFAMLSLRWGRDDDPDAYVQSMLYKAALSRWSRVRPTLEDDEPVREALAGLTAAQRAVFVLLYFEELTEFEIADLLGMSHTAVHDHGQTALSKFRSGLGYGDWRDVGRGERR